MDAAELSKLIEAVSNNSHSMGAKDWITLLGIGLTFVVSAYAAYKTYINGKKTHFINTVTASRVKWIDSLRINVSTLTGTLHSFSWAENLSKEQQHEITLKANCLMDQIKLSLNTNGVIEEKIITLLDILPSEISNTAKLRADLNLMISETQQLLKQEWEVVKSESRLGDLDAKLSDDPVTNLLIWAKSIF